MRRLNVLVVGSMWVLLTGLAARAEVKTVVERHENGQATSQFSFKTIPAPSRNDLASKAKFTLVDGARDRNGGDLAKLNDGQLPAGDDAPAENFFFRAGAEGGRLAIDLGSVIEIKQVNTYSWHPGSRGPQVYKLYGADGAAGDFNAQPKAGTDPEKCGWKLVANVDTRPKGEEVGGQYGVSIADPAGALGKYRYLLLDISRTEDADPFGNTFFSEIDVTDGSPAVPAVAAASNGAAAPAAALPAGQYEIVINYDEMPELKDWVETKLRPALVKWYPIIVQALPSDGYTAPQRFTVTFSKSMRGVAATGGTRVMCAGDWFSKNLDGEAVGAVVHELVHVAQQYRSRGNPGWLVEGVADYIRWFQYEPENQRPRPNPARAKYTDSYRVTAAFLNYLCENHDKYLVRKFNAAMREGKYTPDLWKEYTGKTVDELWDEYIKVLQNGSTINTLSDEEKAAGWKLLFDGKSLDGWHNFKRDGVRPGWQVKNGTLACVDPKNAGDIVTTDKYGWFELSIEYNISEGGNSGIIYHVTDEAGAVWATGPEIQLQDNQNAHDPELCGWLYQLYKPAIDPKTTKPLDATKPAGQWNQVRILLSPEKCEHIINGVKYFEYVLGSDEFNTRVAKSKFGGMPRFAKSETGYLALQGDHGQVSFRNIKIRPIAAKN